MRQATSQNRGALLLVALFMTSLLSLYVVTGTIRTFTDLRAANLYVEKQQMFQLAEGGLNDAMVQVKQRLDAATGQFPKEQDLQVGTSPQLQQFTKAKTYKITVAYQRDAGGNIRQEPVEANSGSFKGLTVQRRVAVVTVETAGAQATTKLRSYIQVDMVQIFQFAIFDYDDLAFWSGAAITIDGPMYAGGTISLHPNRTLTISGTVSAGKDVIHGQEGPGTDRTGDVLVWNEEKRQFGNMKNPADLQAQHGNWLTSTDPQWDTLSADRWGGAVQAHVDPILLPTGSELPATELIEPCKSTDTSAQIDVKICYEADLRILDGKVERRFVSNGTTTWQPITIGNGPNQMPPEVITDVQFYDERETEAGVKRSGQVAATQIDIEKLRQTPFFPKNGILYVGSTQPRISPRAPLEAVRLINGVTLPSQGLTVATHHPLYVKGDYNVPGQLLAPKPPAAFISDAFTVLSDNWDDSVKANKRDNGNRPKAGRNNPKVKTMTLNAAILSGRAQEPDSEHMVRFLEDWRGMTFNFTGSEVSLWQSREATTDLAARSVGDGGAGAVYFPPGRNWKFEKSFLKNVIPPGAPRVYITTKKLWVDCPPDANTTGAPLDPCR